MRARKPPPPKPADQDTLELDVWLEIDDVFEWRVEQLEHAGFAPLTAFRLAMAQADWHLAVAMLNAGRTQSQILDYFVDYD